MFFGRAFLFLDLLILLHSNEATAQMGERFLDVRVGRGTSLSGQGSTSLYLSMPGDGLLGDRRTSMIYLDKSIALSQERDRLDLIVGVIPMAKFELMDEFPRLSFEGGVGLNYLTTRQIGGRRLGMNVLFSPTLAGGIEVPWMDGYLGIFYMFRHLSNASLREDNDGINFHYIVFSISTGRH